MTIATLNPFRYIAAFVRYERNRHEERVHSTHLFHVRDAFDHLGLPLDQLTDSELETLLRHTGAGVAAEIVKRKREAISSVIESSSEAINK